MSRKKRGFQSVLIPRSKSKTLPKYHNEKLNFTEIFVPENACKNACKSARKNACLRKEKIKKKRKEIKKTRKKRKKIKKIKKIKK